MLLGYQGNKKPVFALSTVETIFTAFQATDIFREWGGGDIMAEWLCPLRCGDSLLILLLLLILVLLLVLLLLLLLLLLACLRISEQKGTGKKK